MPRRDTATAGESGPGHAVAANLKDSPEGPTAFRNAAGFRAWLNRHHASETEVLVKLYKVHAKQKGLSYSEALDEALCYGWIDGVRRGGDEESFNIRFTPRKPKSTWSAVNIRPAKAKGQ